MSNRVAFAHTLYLLVCTTPFFYYFYFVFIYLSFTIILMVRPMLRLYLKGRVHCFSMQVVMVSGSLKLTFHLFKQFNWLLE